MVSQISLLGITLHTYGFILGIALLVALQVFQRLLEKKYASISEHTLYTSVSVVLLAALIGARLWHVMTDYWLYTDNFLAVFAIWNGGLSIFGALVGGGIAVLYVQRKWLSAVPLSALFDMVALSIPFGQSLGRWANFVNQELYGAPTNLPWAILIDVPHRLAGYEQYERFHPLFLYESLALVAFGFWLWKQQKKKKIGSGYFLTAYVLSYAALRFLLDFFRIGVPKIATLLSFNQIVLLFVLVIVLLVKIKKKSTA